MNLNKFIMVKMINFLMNNNRLYEQMNSLIGNQIH